MSSCLKVKTHDCLLALTVCTVTVLIIFHPFLQTITNEQMLSIG